MPKVQLRLTQAVSYALKKVYLMRIVFSGAMEVIATYHGKAIITRTAPRQNNDDNSGVTEEQ